VDRTNKYRTALNEQFKQLREELKPAWLTTIAHCGIGVTHLTTTLSHITRYLNTDDTILGMKASQE
jgi:hypothetical protein